MDQVQAKAASALQPFIIEATSAKSPSPRFLKDLIIRATSASGTYIFTDLLRTAAIQSLQTAEDEYKVYLTQLEQFSYGTYEEYSSMSLPELTPAQSQKLRQLSLLTLASPFAPATSNTDPLTYTSLVKSLSLSSTSELESLVTTAIYAGLIEARLSPTSTTPRVLITNVAPLRDLRPESLSAISQILQTWEGRCTNTIVELEGQIQAINAHASKRTALQRKRQDVVDNYVVRADNDGSKAVRPRDRKGNKRDLNESMAGEDDEDVSSDEAKMDVDDSGDLNAGSSNTKAFGIGRKRNRGRGGMLS